MTGLPLRPLPLIHQRERKRSRGRDRLCSHVHTTDEFEVDGHVRVPTPKIKGRGTRWKVEGWKRLNFPTCETADGERRRPAPPIDVRKAGRQKWRQVFLASTR